MDVGGVPAADDVPSISDIPCDVLCKILQYCSDDNLYKLKALASVSEAFYNAVVQILSAIEVADVRYTASMLRSSTLQKVADILSMCPKHIGLLMIALQLEDPSDHAFRRIFRHTSVSIRILRLDHCSLSYSTVLAIGQALPQLQSSKLTDSISRPLLFSNQLKTLSIDWMHTVATNALQPVRSQLCYLSCQGCTLLEDAVCEGLDNCIALDLSNTSISDAGLQKLLDGGAPRLRLLLLNSKAGNLWSDGTWTYSMIERLQAAGVCVIHSAGYKTNLPVIEEYLREALVHSPELRKHAKNVL